MMKSQGAAAQPNITADEADRIARRKIIEDKPLMERLGKLKGMGVDIMMLLDCAEKQAKEAESDRSI
jgi:hypothetical protein